MSDSIWKMPDQERETGKQILEHWKNTDNEDCYAAWLVAHSFDKQTIRWCYIDDLIAQADKAERLQKAVDLAIRGLEKVHMANACITKESQIAYEYLKEIKQLIKGE